MPRKVSSKRIAKRDAVKARHRCTGPSCKYCLQRRLAAASTTEGPAPAKVVENAAKRPPRVPPTDPMVYGVYRDVNGVAYLRVAFTGKGAQFVVNKGFNVELVDIDARSTTTLYMQPVVGASVLEAAKMLLHPLNQQVTISQRAKEHLTTILENKEIQEMATKKATATKTATPKFAAPAATKGTAKTAAAPKAAKAAKTESNGAARTTYAGQKIVVLKKEHGAREGTKRAKGMDIILASKTTDEALAKLPKVGADPSFIRFAVVSGLVKLVPQK